MNKATITIKKRPISTAHPPYIVAELSANHNGELKTALELIKKAKEAGADAVKLQTYRPDTITINSTSKQFTIDSGLWAGKTLYELYEMAHLPWEWHPNLFDYAQELGITLFSSPFDKTAVDYLESLNTPAYKIASFEIVDLPLIKTIAKTGKPLIISTGLASAQEIEEAIVTAREGGCQEIAILHCVSAYPALPKDYNLHTLTDMQRRFKNVVIGLSDHTINNITSTNAIALGASIIEKHFTLDRKKDTPDACFSLEPEEFKNLCIDSRIAWESLGKVDYNCKESELENLQFRRSLYVVKTMSKGDYFNENNVKSIRPGHGMSPKFYFKIIGKKSKQPIPWGSALTENMIADFD